MEYPALVLCKICVSVISALGLYLCTTLCGQLSLGSAGFMALGAYLFAFFGNLSAVPIVFIISFPLGLLLLRLSGDYLAAATLGIAELVRIMLTNLSLLGGAGGYTLSKSTTPIVATVSVLAVWVFSELFSKSKIGHLCKATASDEIGATACGVDTLRLKSFVFAISCGVFALAGCLYAGATGFVCPADFSFTRSCETLAAVMLGGKHPLAVAACATALEILSAVLVGFAEIKMLAYGAVLLICCIRRRHNAY